MKIFLSQPMSGRPEEEILLERAYIEQELKQWYGEDVEVIHSYSSEPKQPLYLLGKAIQAMADADVVYFLPGWEDSRGCKIEYQCAMEYDLECYELCFEVNNHENKPI